MKFFIKDFYSKCNQIRKFTEEILDGKLHFLCGETFQLNCNPRLMSFSHVFDDVTSNLSLRKGIFWSVFSCI